MSTTPKEMTLADAIKHFENQGLVVVYEGDVAQATRILHSHGYRIFTPTQHEEYQKRLAARGGKLWSHDHFQADHLPKPTGNPLAPKK
jgi:hypothetical protein